MSWTLWQGATKLGAVILPFDSRQPEALGGLFDPTEAFAVIGPVMQMPVAGSTDVVQLPFPAQGEAGNEVALEPLAPEARIPPNDPRRLRLVDPVGVDAPVEAIFVGELLHPKSDAAAALAKRCAEIGVPFSSLYLGVRRSAAQAS